MEELDLVIQLGGQAYVAVVVFLQQGLCVQALELPYSKLLDRNTS